MSNGTRTMSATQRAALRAVEWAYSHGKGWRGTVNMTKDLVKFMAGLRDALREDGIEPFPDPESRE